MMPQGGSDVMRNYFLSATSKNADELMRHSCGAINENVLSGNRFEAMWNTGRTCFDFFTRIHRNFGVAKLDLISDTI